MQERRSKLMSVGLWGHNGTGNLGNEATISAIIQNLRKKAPHISLYGFSWNPVDTHQRHGIISFPIRRRSSESNSDGPSAVHAKSHCEYLKSRLKNYPMIFKGIKWFLTPLLELIFAVRACRSLANIDLMLVVGTGLIADTFGGYKNYPYSLFRWSLFCRIRNVKWAIVSVGAGPINSIFSELLIKWALSHSVYRSFRDEYSRTLVEKIGVKGNNHVYPDLVFGLELSEYKSAPPDNEKRIVAFNALPYREPGSWENPSQSIYNHYRELLIQFATWLVEEGYVVNLIPTQLPMDVEFLQRLKEEIITNHPERLHLCTISVAGGVEEVISEFSKADIVVTTRFHGVIFPFLAGKPVLALSYHPKITELMKDFGLGHFCLDIESLDFNMLTDRFKELESIKDDISRGIHEKVEQNKQLLTIQYLKLMSL
jgi:polysaccharide pyruvyl transferase WcaK-like protein